MSFAEPLHVQYMARELNRRLGSNNQYSLRAYARDLQVSAAWLSQVLNAKKGFSPEKAGQLAKALALSFSEKEIFILSAQAFHSRSSQARRKAHEKLAEFKSDKRAFLKLKSMGSLAAVQNWYDNAILELISLYPKSVNSNFVAKKLDISQSAAKSSLIALEKIGLIQKLNDYYVNNYTHTETTQDIPSEAIKQYHKQVLRKAEESLHRQPVSEREFQGLVLAFDVEDTPEAKDDIRQFCNSFAQKYGSQNKKHNSVYQLSIQFFRLDQKGVL